MSKKLLTCDMIFARISFTIHPQKFT